jgi:hypothetical protein
MVDIFPEDFTDGTTRGARNASFSGEESIPTGILSSSQSRLAYALD